MHAIGEDKRELVKVIYEQHWLHMRHVENQRLWFTSVFVILSGGCLTAMRGRLFDEAYWPMVGFLMVLSLVGLLFCLRTQSVLKAHKSVAELILTRYGLEHYLAKTPKTAAPKLFGVSLLFPAFFLLCFCFFLFVLLQMGFHNTWKSAVVPVLLFVAGAVALYLSRYSRSTQLNKE